MKPFVLKQYEKDYAKVRELRRAELGDIVGGGGKCLPTITVTPGQSPADDGSDCDP
jgi:hypothetical protein